MLTSNSRTAPVYAASRLVSLVVVGNLIDIERPNVVLVARNSKAARLANYCSVANSKREGHTLHRKVHRSWSRCDSLDEGRRSKVKRIQVKPGASLSVQKQHNRIEHRVVATGTAEITCGKTRLLLTESRSTYIPLGEVHRLSNPGAIPLEIIDVQSGSYLLEDDIIRFEDHDGRAEE